MRFIMCLGLCLMGLTAAGEGQTSKSGDWKDLLRQGKCQQARSLCAPWIHAPETARMVEGRKCLANVALCENPGGIALTGNDAGGGEMGPDFTPQSVDEALMHLSAALKLAPQDVSIHKGRLHILEMSGRFSQMATALDESCSIYKTKDGALEWLDYTAELFEAKHFRAGLELLRVLEKHYPDSHDVLGNIAAMHMALGEFDQGISYLEKALKIAPGDPIDTWNMARAYDLMGKTEQAEQWYPKALALDPDASRRKSNTCLYAEFVEKKLLNTARACELQKTNCAPSEQTACTAAK
jgi:tetratricopeptide (TPR) repeat protein